MKRKTVTFPVFADYRVVIEFYPADDLQEILKEAGMETAAAAHLTFEGYSQLIFEDAASAESIAHESWHAIHQMFEWAGVTKFENEVTAYHLGYLVGRVSEFQAEVLGVKSKRNKRKHVRKNRSAQRIVGRL